jgi:hypothetical protein
VWLVVVLLFALDAALVGSLSRRHEMPSVAQPAIVRRVDGCSSSIEAVPAVLSPGDQHPKAIPVPLTDGGLTIAVPVPWHCPEDDGARLGAN